MESAPNGRPGAHLHRLDRQPLRVAGAVRDALDECQLLLDHAERAAADLRQTAEDEAFRIRSEAAAEAARRVERAAEAADALMQNAACRADAIIEAAEARQAEVDDRLAAARDAEEAAATAARRTLRDAEAAAARRRQEAEDEGIALLQGAWDSSVRLQQDLLDEAVAEVEEMLRRAEADTALLRRNAEQHFLDAQRFHEEAQRTRADARRYADELATAALETRPEPAAPVAVRSEPEATSRVRTLLRRLVPVALLVAVAVGVHAQVAEPYAVAGASMAPALAEGDRVLVNKLSYRFHDPRRGDVVVIDHDGGTWQEVMVKRVIGLPGEVVELRRNTVRIDGRVVDEDYARGSLGPVSATSVAVADGHVFVLGDNRFESLDSRSLGLVAIDDIVGRVDLVIWPPGSVGRP